MRQQQRRVRCLNTKDQCNTAKMAGEWNAPTRGAVTKRIGLLPTYFQLIAMIRNCQKCFILHLAWRLIWVELNNVEHQHLGIALLRFAAVSIRRNRVVSLDKSILYLKFLCKTSDSTFVLVVHDYVWDRFCCQCAEVNNFLTGPTPQVMNHELFGRQMRSLYVQENAHNYFVFHLIFTPFVAL